MDQMPGCTKVSAYISLCRRVVGGLGLEAGETECQEAWD